MRILNEHPAILATTSAALNVGKNVNHLLYISADTHIN